MKTKLRITTFVAPTLASMMLLATGIAQAAPTRADLDETNFALGLKEAGYSFPSIEEAVQVRRTAIAKAEAAKSQTAVAKAKEANATSKN